MIKKITLLLASCFTVFATFSQVTLPKIWGASPFQDSLWSFNALTFEVVDRIGPSLPGFTITGINGLSTDPCTGENYAILKVSGVTGRVLAKIDLPTGVCTQVGNLGDNFSSITFDKTGQLYGATGNGAAATESFFSIDKTSGTPTLKFAMGNGADGEIICYNRADDNIYHWSGNSTMVFEKFSVSSVAYTPINIPVSGTPGGETFGALYIDPNTFLISNIASSMKILSTTGVYASDTTSTPDDLRGLLMPAVFSLSTDSVCPKYDVVTVNSSATQLYDRIIYNWGDGTADTVNAGNKSHTYQTSGNFIITASLDNGVCPAFVYWTDSVVVKNKPSVALSGLTGICPGASVLLTGTSGGTSQWFLDGAPINGATSNTYSTSTPGLYNMIKTNQNGCYDSASVGKTVINVDAPIVDLGSNITQCGGSVTLDGGNAGASFAWSNSETTQSISVNASGTYEVTVTDANTCTANDDVEVTINAIPAIDLGNDVTQCGGSVTLDGGNAGASFAWSNSETTQSISVNTSGTYEVTVTDANTCTANDDVEVTINTIPTVDLGDDVTQCGGSVTIDGGNAGTSFAWSNNATTQSVSVSASGTYAVTVTDANSCTATDNVQVTINPLPTVTLALATDSICSGTSSISLSGGSPAGGTFFGNNVIGNNFTPSTTGLNTINYAFSDGNGCADTASGDILVYVCVGINELTSGSVVLFPNPSSSFVTIRAEGILGRINVAVSDIQGKEMTKWEDSSNGLYTYNLNLNGYSKGTYIAQITTTNGRASYTFVVK